VPTIFTLAVTATKQRPVKIIHATPTKGRDAGVKRSVLGASDGCGAIAMT
jgi:hypothetical protein